MMRQIPGKNLDLEREAHAEPKHDPHVQWCPGKIDFFQWCGFALIV
jgi:hypothetical protein